MAAVKKIKKAQAGDAVKKVVTEKKLRPSAISAMTDQFKGKSSSVDTVARKKAIKSGKFREDLKSGDFIPVKKTGGKVAKKAMGGAKMKMGGKCKYGC